MGSPKHIFFLGLLSLVSEFGSPLSQMSSESSLWIPVFTEKLYFKIVFRFLIVVYCNSIVNVLVKEHRAIVIKY